MVYNSLHSHLIERRFDEAKLDVIKHDLNSALTKEMHNRDLPLHMALLVDAPDELVIAIYNAYPEAANVKSHDKKTALEIAQEKRRLAEVCDTISGKEHPSPRKSRRRSSLGRYMRSSLDFLLKAAISK